MFLLSLHHYTAVTQKNTCKLKQHTCNTQSHILTVLNIAKLKMRTNEGKNMYVQSTNLSRIIKFIVILRFRSFTLSVSFIVYYFF